MLPLKEGVVGQLHLWWWECEETNVPVVVDQKAETASQEPGTGNRGEDKCQRLVSSDSHMLTSQVPPLKGSRALKIGLQAGDQVLKT